MLIYSSTHQKAQNTYLFQQSNLLNLLSTSSTVSGKCPTPTLDLMRAALKARFRRSRQRNQNEGELRSSTPRPTDHLLLKCFEPSGHGYLSHSRRAMPTYECSELTLMLDRVPFSFLQAGSSTILVASSSNLKPSPPSSILHSHARDKRREEKRRR